MALEIREPLTRDIARLQWIEDAADERFRSRFEREEWWPAGPGEARVTSQGFLFVAAESAAGEAVGFVHVLEVDGLAHLEQLAVLPEYGRRGYGRALVTAALTEAAGRGYNQVTLRTYADVPWNGPFYEKCGFVESEPDLPFLLDLVQVEKQLGLTPYGRRMQMTTLLPQDQPRAVD